MTTSTGEPEAIPSDDPVRCPRCGYDQYGEIAQWTDRCPLESTCTECGLRIRWTDVLSPRRRGPRWCVEYAAGVRSFLGRGVCTLLLAYWPWRFWSSLKMTHEIRWRGIAGLWVILLVLGYVLFCLGQVVIAWSHWSASTPWGGFRVQSLNLWDYLRVFLLPFTDWAPSWRLPGGGWGAGGAGIMNSPRDFIGWHWNWIPYVVVTLVAFQVCCAATFLTLPVSRRVAKVRWAHIYRVALYGLLLATTPFALMMVSTSLMAYPGRTMNAFLIVIALVPTGLAWLLPVWFVFWWSAATGRYLKMRHPWGVGIAVVVVAILIVLLSGVLISWATLPNVN